MSGTLPLEGKVAVVTGSGRNIGRTIALALAEDGADLLVHVRRSHREGEEVAEEARRFGRRAVVGVADVRDEAAIRSIFDAARRELGPILILVNSAAVRREAPFEALTHEEWRDVVGAILDGAFVCSRTALADMRAAGWGRIVNVIGLSGQAGAAYRAHVVTAKAGLVGFTKALALEYASEGVTVNAVSPGMIDTVRDPATSPAEPHHHRGRVVPVGRLGTPGDVASAVRFLASPAAGYVTGQTLNVNGGTYL